MQVHRNASDEEVVRCVRSGEASAFGYLVDRYKNKALSLAVRLLKNEHDAEDALQESFIKAYTALASFRHDASFATWFYRIVYTTCLNVLKKQRRRQSLIELEDEHMVGSLADYDTSVLNVEAVERTISEELASMPSLYAAVMDLFYVQERSYDDIVVITGLPLGTVKTRLNRGRHALRRALLKKIPDLESWLNNK